MPINGRRRRLFKKRQLPGVSRTRRTRFRRNVRGVIMRMSETKFNYQGVVNANCITVPSIISWSNALAQGTGNNQRIGRQIRVKSLSYKLWMNTVYGAAGATKIAYRFLVLYPRKGVDDVAVANEINLMTYTTRLDPALVYVISDRTGWVGMGDATVNLPTCKTFKWFKKTRYEFNFDNAGVVKREPVFVYLSSLPAADNTDLILNGYVSMSFKDI